MISYAGIGSRETPNAVIAQMKMIGAMFGSRGYVLRSGCAKPPLTKRAENTDSADLAFEAGAKSVNGPMVLRVSSYAPNAMAHAAQFHPNWGACDDYARSRHARNSVIMQGDNLDDPVAFVTCWTDGGGIKGGTGQALRIAAALQIPVFNLWHPTAFGELMAYVGRL